MTSYVNTSVPFAWRAAVRPSATKSRRGMVPGRLGRRVAACLVDAVVVTVLGAATAAAVVLPATSAELDQSPIVAAVLGFASLLVPAWIYFAAQESSRLGATLGKRAMDLKVVGLRGERISFGRASGRFVIKALSLALVPFAVVSLVAVFASKSRATLHDMLENTLVVEDRG